MRTLLLALCFFLVACEDTNVQMVAGAVKDATTAITLSENQVAELAQEAAKSYDAKNKVAPPSNPYSQRLARLTDSIQTYDGQDFNFRVYPTKDVNAFAMADGTIRVYSGLMDIMNDDELLFVIGHEMGHVALNHSHKQAVLAYASQAVRKGLASQNNEIGAIASSALGAFTEKLVGAQFSQHEEAEADQYGLAFLKDQGISEQAGVTALQKLAALSENTHTFLSSHPEPGKRADKLLTPQEPEPKGFLESLYAFVLAILSKVWHFVLYIFS